jgi:DNA-directed RNA polymerase subunit beta'
MIWLYLPKKAILKSAEKEVADIEEQYVEGLITKGEKYNKVIDIWATATDEVANEMMEEMKMTPVLDETGEVVRGEDGEILKEESFNSIYIMADSGSRGSKDQMRQLAGMRGLMAKPSGEIIETPITANFREGLSVLQYFISTHGARKGLADTALKTANSGYLTRRLVDVSQDSIITEEDCGVTEGIEVKSLVEGGEIIQRVGERILGRVALEDIEDPFTNEVLVKADEEIDEAKVQKIDEAGVEQVKIRSGLTCRSKIGLCAKCYGRDLAYGKPVQIGQAIGILAAQSIGEPGTQLTMRTFHIGGTASRRVEQADIRARSKGVVKYLHLETVENVAGESVAMNRNGEVAVISPNGRERERYPVIYGAHFLKKDGDPVDAGNQIAVWDTYTTPILTEVSGKIKFGDIIAGRTMTEKVDPVTGKVSMTIVEYKDAEMRPRISIKNERGRTIKIPGTNREARYILPLNAILSMPEGDMVTAGDIIAKIPRETTKTKDITGGLPRVADLFEVRKPKECAVITEIDGYISFSKGTKGKRKLTVTPTVGDKKEYLIPKGKHLSVNEGDYVRSGEALMEGSVDPHDILNVKGFQELARYLVDEVQEVYRLQGVRINDKHIEIIVRQMLRRVKIIDPGDTSFMIDQQIEICMFQDANEAIVKKGGRPATAEPLLLGITKASLSTDSFISAASFQETTKVLSEAAVSGRVDTLRGLKENVIMGRIIPAGTGVEKYRNSGITSAVDDAEV